ncbi:MAG TPA: VTT domain-containing protein [Candidatus Saccharimonadales bacterium]|jgi:membrane protein DedA with SNARE-associated domain|nr:VTT domain-containing protein [Candidatus Saccharimonadales bacterium]
MIQTSEIFKLLFTYSYLILFPLVVVEGPIVTIIAGFLVSLGFMDFIPTYLTIVSGDLVGDFVYYSAGRWWLNKTYKGVLNFFSIDMKIVRKLETAIKKRKGPFLFFGKLSHAVGGIILFAAGSAEIPLKEFLWFNFLATLPKSLILIAVGYYFGSTVSNFKKYLDFTVLGLFVLTVVLIGLYYGVTYLSNKFINKMEK